MLHAHDIVALFEYKGHLSYDGEPISQTMHGWQCSQLARAAGAPATLQLAAWLHDVGHLMSQLAGSPTLRGIDDRHEISGAQCLLGLWGPEVAEPVRLHVDAKRYLVARHAGYLEQLSADSLRSLALQGGAMNDRECRTFEALPHSRQALQLRAWDDAGKRAGWFAADTACALQELSLLMQSVPVITTS